MKCGLNGTAVCGRKQDLQILTLPFLSSWVRLELKHKDVAAPAEVAKWKTYVTIDF